MSLGTVCYSIAIQPSLGLCAVCSLPSMRCPLCPDFKMTAVEAMLQSRFYEEVIGCKELPRPPFPFGGAWLKAGSNLIIHLIQEDPSVPHKKPSNWEVCCSRHIQTACCEPAHPLMRNNHSRRISPVVKQQCQYAGAL